MPISKLTSLPFPPPPTPPFSASGQGLVASVNQLIDTSAASLKSLPSNPQTDTVYGVIGFYAGSTTGGGRFIWSPSLSKSLHNGVTRYAPEALAAWNGTQAGLSTLLNWTGAGSGCWVRSDLQGFVTPEMAGAVGDGASDDVRSINAAINSQAALGGVVQLLEATYGVGTTGGNRSIIAKANVWIKGAGVASTIVRALPASNSVVIAFETNASDIWVTDFTIDGNKAAQTLEVGGVHCIRMQGNKRPKIQRMNLIRGHYYGIGVGFTPGVEESVEDGEFTDIEISYCGNDVTMQGDGFDGKRIKRSSFNNIRCHHNAQRGLDIRGEENIYDNIWAYNNGATGISFRALGTLPSTISTKHYIKATNCYAFNNADLGFFIANNEAPLTGFDSEYDLVNCHSWDNAVEGFQHRGSDMLVRYVNCTARGNTTNGFRAASIESNSNTRAKYTNCDSIGNGGSGFLISPSLGKHSFVSCTSKLNNGVDQVSIQSADCEWFGGTVDATGKQRGINSTVDAPRLSIIGGSFYNGSINAIRFDGASFQLSGAKIFQAASTAVRVASTATSGNIIGNDFTGVTGGTLIANETSSTNVLANIGVVDAVKTPYVAGNVNYFEINTSASGQPVIMRAAGSNTTIDVLIEPKGASGRVRYGTHTASTDAPVTGYIEIKDASGTIRKLAVIS